MARGEHRRLMPQELCPAARQEESRGLYKARAPREGLVMRNKCIKNSHRLASVTQ